MSEQSFLPPEREFPSVRQRLLRQHLVAQARAGLLADVRRPARRVAAGAIGLAGAAIIAAGAYGGYLLSRPAVQHATIGCYAGPSLGADTAVVAAVAGTRPVEACAATWAQAFPGVEQPPQLSACVLDSGAVGVFPGRNVCARLGIARLDESPAALVEADRFAAFVADIDDQLATVGCAAPRDVRSRVAHSLTSHGLSAWRIVSGPGRGGEGFSAERPCAGLAFDERARTIVLVPEEVPNGKG